MDTDGAAELTLLLVVIGYFAVMTLIILICRKIKGNKRQSLVRTRRQRIQIFLQRSHLLERIDTIQTCLSLALCMLYVVETYGISRIWFYYAERVVNILFALDYVLQFYLSRDKLRYIFSFMPCVDVLTIVPLMVSNYFYIDSRNTSIVLRIVRVSKLFRVLRSFRFIRSRPEDITREVSLLVFTIACLIFTAAGFYQLIENDWVMEPGKPATIAFHKALYFCSIEVLGRPRLEPSGPAGHILLILVVSVSCIVIPRQLASIFQALQKDLWSHRTAYQRFSDSHIVIMGHVEFPVLNLLLYETYHPDRGPVRPCDIVVLSSMEPDHQIKELLSHPSYAGNVQYIQGSPQNEKDLERCRVADAVAVLVMACKYPADPYWEDTQVASVVLACKAYKNAQLHRTNAFEGRRRLRVLAQVLSADARDRIMQMPGWDRHQDLCLVIGELTAAMVAGSALHKGLATMVLNLVSHSTPHDLGNSEKWFRLYNEGAMQEIYHCSIAQHSILCDQDLVEAAHYLLSQHRMLLIAVKQTTVAEGCSTPESRRTNQSLNSTKAHRLILFPGHEGQKLRVGDRVYVIAQSLPEVVQAIKSRRPFRPNGAVKSAGSEREGSRNSRLVTKPSLAGQLTWEEEVSSPNMLQRIREGRQQVSGMHIRKGLRQLFATGLRWGTVDLKEHDPTERPDFAPTGSFKLGQLEIEKNDDDDRGSPRDPGSNASAMRATSSWEVADDDALLPLPSLRSLSSARSSRSHALSEELRGGNMGHIPSEFNGSRRRERLAELLGEYGPDLEGLMADLKLLGINGELSGGSEIELSQQPHLRPSKASSCSFPDEIQEISSMTDYVVICGGDQTSIVFTVNMLLMRHATLEVLVTGLSWNELRPDVWQGVEMHRIHIWKDLHPQSRQLEKARAVIILPTMETEVDPSARSVGNRSIAAPVQGLELRRIVDSDTILTTNIIATRKRAIRAESTLSDVWTVSQLLQEGSLGRFFGMAPEAQGASCVIDDRWMASRPLNMNPLFAAGHVIATTTVDRFLIESFFNPDAMIIVERLFGLAGLMIGSKVKHGLGSPSHGNFPCAFQVSASDDRLRGCSSYGDISEALLSSSEPMLPLGVFRYPKGERSSYSMLVSLEAVQELDFRSPKYGRTLSKIGAKQSRLPYVITNPARNLEIWPSDIIFVLGRPNASKGWDFLRATSAGVSEDQTPKESLHQEQCLRADEKLKESLQEDPTPLFEEAL